MSYREYWVFCPQSSPATPPPIEEQLTTEGYQRWSPQLSCARFTRIATNEGDEIPYDFAQHETWPQGRYMISTPERAAAVADWYECPNHRGTRLQVFRQRAAYDRRYNNIMSWNSDSPYNVVSFGTDTAPWPDFVPEERRGYRRYAFFPKRPPARSTASLWA